MFMFVVCILPLNHVQAGELCLVNLLDFSSIICEFNILEFMLYLFSDFLNSASFVKGVTGSMSMNHGKSSSFHQSSQGDQGDFAIVKPESLEKRKKEKTDTGMNGHSFSKAIGRPMLQNQLPDNKLKAQRMTQHESSVQYIKSANVFRGKLFCFSNLFPEERVSFKI